jgi:hypothetical protein
MSALKLHTLKQKLWAIVAVSFVVRVILILALPNRPLSISTDEYAYGPLTEMTALGTLGQQEIYYQDLYKYSRTLVLPASLLYRFGVDQLDAIRIISSLYSFLSLIFVVLIAVKFSHVKKENLVGKPNLNTLIFGFILLYAFFPSRFLWSVVGYRESANEFWVMCVFIFTYAFYSIGSKNRLLMAFLLGLSIILLFSSRPQVGLLVTITLLFASLFKLRNRLTVFFTLTVMVGSTVGYISTTSFAVVVSDVYSAKETTTIAPTKEPAPNLDSRPQAELEAVKLCDGSNPTVKIENKTYRCTKIESKREIEGLKNPATIATENIELIRNKQLMNQKNAESVIEIMYCPFEGEEIANKIACLIWRAPYASATFLFRPLPFIDTTSLTSYFAAAENILWIIGVFFLVYSLIVRRELNLASNLLPVMIFSVLYVVGAGSYQGNLGTAFRHKSLIFWILLLLIYSTLSAKKSLGPSKSGNNSQESAV